MKRLARGAGWFVLAALFSSLVFAAYIWLFPDSAGQADLVVVFRGAPERYREGLALARASRGKVLLLSSMHTPTLKHYRRKYGWSGVETLVGQGARTTFEDALVCRPLIRRLQARRVLLVTSDYHMPRAYLMLRLMMLGSGVEINRHSAASTLPFFSNAIKEWLKIWYSLGEFAYFQLLGRMPETAAKELLRQWPAGRLLPPSK